MIAFLFQKRLGHLHLVPGTDMIEERGREVMTERDDQGWQVLHQRVADGKDEVVHFLLEQGADINTRTFVGGETPLRIAGRKFGFHSSLTQYLKSMGR
jgi:ankyrin repeat protein